MATFLLESLPQGQEGRFRLCTVALPLLLTTLASGFQSQSHHCPWTRVVTRMLNTFLTLEWSWRDCFLYFMSFVQSAASPMDAALHSPLECSISVDSSRGGSHPQYTLPRAVLSEVHDLSYSIYTEAHL